MRTNSGSINFIIMNNLFSNQDRYPISEQYDLKGSTIDRHVGLDSGEEGMEGCHIALKDVDFKERNRRIFLGPKRKALLLEQLEKDCAFLESHNICDYSLLVGFHFLKEGEELPPLSEEDDEDEFEQASFKHQRKAWQKQSPRGMYCSMDGRVVYFIGIIDHLTSFNLSKRAESRIKSLLHNSDMISAMAPTPYRTRFQKFIASIID